MTQRTCWKELELAQLLGVGDCRLFQYRVHLCLSLNACVSGDAGAEQWLATSGELDGQILGC